MKDGTVRPAESNVTSAPHAEAAPDLKKENDRFRQQRNCFLHSECLSGALPGTPTAHQNVQRTSRRLAMCCRRLWSAGIMCKKELRSIQAELDYMCTELHVLEVALRFHNLYHNHQEEDGHDVTTRFCRQIAEKADRLAQRVGPLAEGGPDGG